MPPRTESDRQILTRLDERVDWLVKHEEKRADRMNNHANRIGALEKFRSYTVGIAAGVSAIVSLIFLALRLQWLP